MTSPGDGIAARARSLVGTAYRPKGRSAAGLDCVGVAAAVFSLRATALPAAYHRRTGTADALAGVLREQGFELQAGEAATGDLLIFVVGVGQLHLGISTGRGFVHADGGLGRVVERPFPAPWPILGVWRAVQRSLQERDLWQPFC